jgi:hypothetical protein
LRSCVDVAITAAHDGVSGMKKAKLTVPDRILVPFLTKAEIERRVEKCLLEWGDEFGIGYVAAVVTARAYINDAFFDLLQAERSGSASDHE